MDEQRLSLLWRLVTERADRRRFSGWVGVVCDVVVEQVRVDAAAVTVRSTARAQELVAATGQLAREIEELQYTVGEGPGVEAFDIRGPVLVADLTSMAEQWPGFADAATGNGAAAVFAFPLQTGAIRLGTLDLYRQRPGGLSPHELADAAALAELATTALLTDTRGADIAPWARGTSPGHYDDVNIATGMLAAELRISLEDAFLRLRAHAFSHNQPILDVSRAILARELRLDTSQD